MRVVSSRLQLDYSVSWQDLKDLFKEEGFNPLRTDILGNDGLSKGAGTVLFATPQEAQDAIAKLNGYELKGRRMDVHLVCRPAVFFPC